VEVIEVTEEPGAVIDQLMMETDQEVAEEEVPIEVATQTTQTLLSVKIPQIE